MTPEQIEKEKADKIEKAPAIQSDKADIKKPEINSTELVKISPVDTAPPKESNRQYAKKVGDYKRVVELAKEKGVDLDNIGEMPLMDSDKGKITEAVKSAYGRELATGIQGISDAIQAPSNEERSKLDVKVLMDLERKKRRSRWSDALYAFGEGLQGKTANPEAFASTKIQRKQDEQFQNFKDVTERNQKTKYLWENQTKKELVSWAEEQAKNERLDAKERARFQQLADRYNQTAERSDRDAAERARHNKAMENKASGSGGNGGGSKAEKTVKIQTAQKTYDLKPEEADFYKGEILKNAETLRMKYPGWFTETQEINPLTNAPIGGVTYKLNPQVEDTDMIRAYLENKEPGKLNEEAYEKNKTYYFDKYRKEKGLPTSDVSVSETTKASPKTQPKQETQKQQHSTGGLY
jgi:hypothetical protein